MPDWETELDEIIDDLKLTGEGFYTRVAEVRRPIIERAVRRIGELTALKLTNPSESATYEVDIRHNFNTLTSEAALVQALGEDAFWNFVARLINRLTNIAMRIAFPTP